jgi:N-acetylmuramoyl-L-alanine amidase
MKKLILAAAAAILMAQPAMAYSEDDLYELSHIINAEAGDAACSDELRIAVGSVVLNRVASDLFPDSIYAVIHQEGQYRPTWDGGFLKEPSEASVEVAKMLLEEGSQLPGDCLYQANFVQGSAVYEQFNTIYGPTYICVQ